MDLSCLVVLGGVDHGCYVISHGRYTIKFVDDFLKVRATQQSHPIAFI